MTESGLTLPTFIPGDAQRRKGDPSAEQTGVSEAALDPLPLRGCAAPAGEDGEIGD